MNDEKRNDSAEASTMVTQGHTLLRMQDETIQAIARVKPRNLRTVQASVAAEISLFAKDAHQYFYSIPHRSQRCKHASGQRCKECTMVEGASIVLAETLLRYFGNCDTAWMPHDETEDYIWFTGTFVDYQTGARMQKSYRMSKWQERRDGKKMKLDGKWLTQAMNAAGAKAQRNAIVAGIGRPIVRAAWEHAKSLMVGKQPTKKLTKKEREEIVNVFGSKYNVPAEAIERAIGVKQAQWTGEERASLRGMFTALAEGTMSAEEMFGPAPVKKTQAKKKGDQAKEPEVLPPSEATPPDPDAHNPGGSVFDEGDLGADPFDDGEGMF